MHRHLTLLGLVLWSLALSGCGATVTPPLDPVDPVPVFLANHGIHTSLLIPREEGRVAQFAFSQWHWAALDQDGWLRSPFAIAIPNTGTLGRRDFECACEQDELCSQFDREGVFPPVKWMREIRVARADRDRVLGALDERWRDNAQTRGEQFNERRGMAFTRDKASYSLGHTCNHEVAQWLRDLGCEVSGMAVSSDFDVKPPGR